MSTYGCFDRKPFAASFVMHGISKQTGRETRTIIPFRMARECQYTHTELGQKDKGCKNCIHFQEATNEQ